MTKLLFALLAFTATPAFAEPPAEVSSIVQTADLDLASQSGKRILDRRISLAVAEVCGTASDADLAGQNDVRECRKVTLAAIGARRDEILAQARSTGTIRLARAN